jgi:hypothetical protein
VADTETKGALVNSTDGNGISTLIARGFVGTAVYLEELRKQPLGESAGLLMARLQESRVDIYKLFTLGGIITLSGKILASDINWASFPTQFQHNIEKERIVALKMPRLKLLLGSNYILETDTSIYESAIIMRPNLAPLLTYWNTCSGYQILPIPGSNFGKNEQDFLRPFINHTKRLISGIEIPKGIYVPPSVLARQVIFDIGFANGMKERTT